MPLKPPAEYRFIVDRMLGTLTRYLRFMGYDTISANDLAEGNAREDTFLLDLAERENRILLTRDTELARRGNDRAVLIREEDVMIQVQRLVDLQFIERRLLMSRCSLCNTVLREATIEEISGTEYAPAVRSGLTFFWCVPCRKLYWNGSHAKDLEKRIGGT